MLPTKCPYHELVDHFVVIYNSVLCNTLWLFNDKLVLGIKMICVTMNVLVDLNWKFEIPLFLANRSDKIEATNQLQKT